MDTSVPILVLGNKTDNEGAMSERKFRDYMDLSDLMMDRSIQIFMCSVRKNEGYQKGFRWLRHFIE